MRKKTYDDDDGHTVVDMSYVGKRPMLGAMFVRFPPNEKRKQEPDPGEQQEPIVLTKKEKRFAVLGAMKAGLVIGGIYIGALVAIIVLLLVLWRAF